MERLERAQKEKSKLKAKQEAEEIEEEKALEQIEKVMSEKLKE